MWEEGEMANCPGGHDTLDSAEGCQDSGAGCGEWNGEIPQGCE